MRRGREDDRDGAPDHVRDAGQAVPLLAAVVLVAGLAVVGLGTLGAAAVQAARARTAADAAALAGVMDGEPGARRLAGDNGGELVSFTRTGEGDVVVVVRVGRARATARAMWSWAT
jgi:Zn-dependent alcohol dehydrogenase